MAFMAIKVVKISDLELGDLPERISAYIDTNDPV